MEDTLLSLSLILGVVLGFVLLLVVWHPKSGISNSGAGMPKGSVGWPVIGETLAFARDPRIFYDARVRMYGRVFKSSLFGNKAIVGTTSDFAKLILTKNTLFENSWPQNITATMGKNSWVFRDGPWHVSVKKVFAKSLLPETLRYQVGMLETIILRNLDSWAERGNVNSNVVCRALTMEAGLYVILGINNITATPEGRTLVENLRIMGKALSSIPVNLPGSNFRKGLEARKSVAAYFKNMIQQRRSEAETGNDMLAGVLASTNDPQAATEVKDLDDETLVDSFVHVWFGSYDTVATTLLWCLKLLRDYPGICQRVRAEQEEIRKSKAQSGQSSELTWEDLKAMEYSSKFLSEVLRFTSLTNTLIRKALQETEFQGQRIPKGWSVVASLTSIHHNSANFPDPSSFDPSRFNSSPKPYTILPFGGGAHMCPGIELVKVVVLVYIHHITTTFTYYSTGSAKGNSTMIYQPFMAPENGYPVNFSRLPRD